VWGPGSGRVVRTGDFRGGSGTQEGGTLVEGTAGQRDRDGKECGMFCGIPTLGMWLRVAPPVAGEDCLLARLTRGA
jgi:hypothetical protein